MKKSYSKPKIFIESFEISEFIAGDCTIDVGFGDSNMIKQCTYADPDFGGAVIYFNSGNEACVSKWDDGDDKGCYHIPDGGQGYFGS